MGNSNDKKAAQLGMPIGTASNRLRKEIIFLLIKRLNENFCFQCGLEIETANEVSVEHKIPYLDSADPVKLFFDLDNIAFSHLDCNSSASRARQSVVHSQSRYSRGCRCGICKDAHAVHNGKWRAGKKD